MEKALCARIHSTESIYSDNTLLCTLLSLTCFFYVDLADVLELPDGDVQGAECPCPPYPGAAVHHNGRPQGVASPGGGHSGHQLCLLLPHTLTWGIVDYVLHCHVPSYVTCKNWSMLRALSGVP